MMLVETNIIVLFLRCTGNDMEQCFHFAKCAPAIKTAFFGLSPSEYRKDGEIQS
jgi:hypothetical protein